jgi:hypothetical protein
MTTEVITAILLIVMPVAFTLAFIESGRYIAWSVWLIALGVFLLV